jgi:hypothetical protein
MAYIDGTLDDTETLEVYDLLQRDIKFKHRYDELLAADNLLHKFVFSEQPSPAFTNNVMNRLHETPKRSPIRGSVILLVGILTVVGIVAGFVSVGLFDGAMTVFNMNNLNEIQDYKIPVTLPTVPFDAKMLVNVILLVNVFLALIVLDRTVLKPFFRKRIRESI